MKHAVALGTLLLLAGCSDLVGLPSRDEVTWADSPDGRTHAILLETNGGATTSFGYAVELHPAPHRGQRPTPAGKLYGATRSSCAYGVNLRWLSPTELALEFTEANDISVPAKVRLGTRTIIIVQTPGILDESAPCGGMLAAKG